MLRDNIYGMAESIPNVVVVPAGEVFEWDCPYCGRTHKTVLKPPVVTGCSRVVGNVRLIALPVKKLHKDD
jgi:hypothetical protein